MLHYIIITETNNIMTYFNSLVSGLQKNLRGRDQKTIKFVSKKLNWS